MGSTSTRTFTSTHPHSTSRIRGLPVSKPLIAVDFDGTCVENLWPAMGDWLPGAVDHLHKLTEFAILTIHTSRIAPMMPDGTTRRTQEAVFMEVARIRNKLDEAGLRHVSIHTQPWKPGAVAYLDDKAVRFSGHGKGAWIAAYNRLAAICKEELIDYDE